MRVWFKGEKESMDRIGKKEFNPKSKIQNPKSPDTPLPLYTGHRTGRRHSGWHVGIALGVLFGLLCLPPVRYTLSSQLAFAFAEDSIPWMRALDTRNVTREATRLDAAASAVPGDYLMQLGRATAQAGETTKSGGGESTDDETLDRVARVTRDFPTIPGAYAHLARYMTASHLRIKRGEIDSRYAAAPRPDPTVKTDDPPISPRHPLTLLPLSGDSPRSRRRDIQLMEWACRAGDKRDSDNAFWLTMLATAYFSAGRDKEALAALQKASRKSEWNAYIHEEILGQWRLYSATYGDNGAAQKIAPLSLVSFPHLLEIRHTAEIARALADRAAAAGRIEEAVKIRRSVAWIGIQMRSSARWSLEALCGADIVLIISSDAGEKNRPIAIQNEKDWENQAANYLALLKKRRLTHEISWLRDEVNNSCALRAQVDIARYDASYPGIPPGIPLVPLFGNWVIGVCLLQQMLGLSAAACVAAVCRRFSNAPRPLRLLLRFAVLFGALIFGSLLWTGIPTTRLALGFILCLTALALFTIQGLSREKGEKGGKGRGNREQGTGNREENIENTTGGGAGIENRKSEIQNQEAFAELRWRPATTARLLGFLLPLGAGLLYWLRPELSFLHPVAALLMSVMGATHFPTPLESLSLALMACGLPVTFVLLVGLWGLYRRVSPMAGVSVGLRRSVFPALACLSLLYLGLLYWTLQLDAAASRGISEVAQNDLQWVLTHSAPPDDSDD